MRKLLWNITWLIFRPLLKIFCGFKLKGEENLKNLKAPFIIAIAPHHNRADPFIVGAALPFNSDFFPIRYMTAEKYMKMPVLGTIIRIYGGFEVARGIDREKAIQPAIALLKKEEVIGIFIEGKLSKKGEFGFPKPGIGLLALKTGLPVLPAALTGTARLSFFNFFSFQRNIAVSFGQPIFAKDSVLSYNEISQIVMDKIKKLL